MFEPRAYRDLFKGNDLVFFNCAVRETDLQIGVRAEQELPELRTVQGNPGRGSLCSFWDSGESTIEPGGEHTVKPATAKSSHTIKISLSGGLGGTPGSNVCRRIGHVARPGQARSPVAATIIQTEAFMSVMRHRASIEDYAARHPEFITSFVPLKVAADAPAIVRRMCLAGELAGVGPMAAVAGAISEFVGMDLLQHSLEVIVENGGDIFLKTSSTRKIGIYAGSSPLSEKMALEIPAASTPLGICTSSGTVGHSVSFGHADAAVVLAQDTALADAVATALGNIAQSESDLKKAVRFASKVPGISGALVILGDKMAVWGEVKLVGM